MGIGKSKQIWNEAAFIKTFTALDNSRHWRHVYTLCLEPKRKWSDCARAQQKPETVLGQIGRFWPAKNELNSPRKKAPQKIFSRVNFSPRGECNMFSRNSANSRPVPMPASITFIGGILKEVSFSFILVIVCLLVAWRPSNMLVYLRDGSAQTILRAATLRQKLQIQRSTSPSHGILTPGRPVPALTL